MSPIEGSILQQFGDSCVQNKLIIMLYTGCRFDVLNFLSQPEPGDESPETTRPKSADGRKRLEYHSAVNFEGIDADFNIFMCYGNYVNLDTMCNMCTTDC